MMSGVPESFTKQFGKCVEIDSSNDSADMQDDYISWFLLERACGAAKLAFEQNGFHGLNVSMAYLAKFDPRAFAWWSSKTPKQFVIGYHNGTGPLLRETFENEDFLSLLPDDSFLVNKLHTEELYDLAVSLVLATIFYHEVAHIVRFHLPYLAEIKVKSPEMHNKFVGMCEADADKWAAYNIAPDLLSQAKGIQRAMGVSAPLFDILSEILTLYGSVLHIWFAIFNQTSFVKSSIYPHPLIRSTRIAIGAADNIPIQNSSETIHLGLAIRVLKGLELAEKSNLRSESAKQHQFDLFTEIQEIDNRFEEIEQALEPALSVIREKWKAGNAFQKFTCY